jgi:hypothetical protein
LALFTLGGVVVAQQTQPKPEESGSEVILKAGQAVVMGESKSIEDLLPANCKTWSMAEIPGRANTIFICKDGKWTEYVQKDKMSLDMIPKDKLAMLCAEADTGVPEPKPVTKTPVDKKANGKGLYSIRVQASVSQKRLMLDDPVKVPLLFEEAVSGSLKAKPDPKLAKKTSK